MKTLKAFRKVGFWEGISYLTLVGNMILKRIFEYIDITYIIGMVHGVLFIGFCILLAKLWFSKEFSFKEVVLSFVASLLPFGTFVADDKIWKFHYTYVEN